jgi:hypothetical protein
MLVPLLTVVPITNVVTNPVLNLAFELLVASLRQRLSTRQDYIGSLLGTNHGRLIPFPICSYPVK